MNFKEQIIEIMEKYETEVGGNHWDSGDDGIPAKWFDRVADEIEAMIERHITITYNSN